MVSFPISLPSCLRMVTLDKQLILRIAKSRDIYETPELNETLFLHQLCITCISPLLEYHQIEFLSLEQNSLTSMCGISQFPNLRYLKLDHNLLTCVCLDPFPRLEQFHASHNSITRLDFSTKNENLKILKLCHNKLSMIPDVSNLESLEVLDVSRNIIHELALDRLRRPSSLKQLYLSPNPFISSVRNYRKSLLAHLACMSIHLTYLDTSFVTEEESAIAQSPMNEIEIRKKFALGRKNELERRVSDFYDLHLMYDERGEKICAEIREADCD